MRLHYPWQLDFDAPLGAGDFSPNGHLICSASGATVHVFDSGTGNEVATYTGHEKNVRNVKFSADSSMVISADVGGTVRLWKAPVRMMILPIITKNTHTTTIT